MPQLKRELSFREWIFDKDESFQQEDNSDEDISDTSFIAYIIFMISVYLKEIFLP